MNEYDFLNSVEELIQKDQEARLQNKDFFNVFSILNLKRAENRTHSAFIAELLDPNGSHHMGVVFLKHFLQVVGYPNDFDLKGVRVYKEYHLGFVDFTHKKGGRLDILLTNDHGQTICIENKIDAKLGKDQIERYLNFNRGKNFVYLLTKEGNLEINLKHEYFMFWKHISYYEDIINWLNLCLNEVVDYPNLFESIKQYRNLISEITNQFDSTEMNEDLKSIIVNNISASRQIARNYDALLLEIKEKFRQKVYSHFVSYMIKHIDWNVVLGNSAEATYSQVWIQYKKSKKRLWFGLEGFSGKRNFTNNLFMGIISIENDVNKVDFDNFINDPYINTKGWWYEYIEVVNTEKKLVNFSNDEFVAKLYDSDYSDRLARQVASDFYNYFMSRNNIVKSIVE